MRTRWEQELRQYEYRIGLDAGAHGSAIRSSWQLRFSAGAVDTEVEA
jgi:hypothetical protein